MSKGRRGLRGEGRLTAILGPTNTGKTYRAIEKMLGHKSGMIGLPLRLLAREVYDKIVARKGVDAVALVTGEEKRIPVDARYWVCTVEAMPVDKPVAFVAIDEIQLAGDRNRGHVFTDRILRARGVHETMFLGSDTIEALLEDLVPEVQIERRPRLSKLTSVGCNKLTSVPRRSAVVAFSAERVYEYAERLRAVHGGTAVVLGALSPRARNAQVALYESGEVHYMVATDAIGMGLNMDIRHVAFTALRKFDGRGHRALMPAEVAQIAGRAGRFHTDGTFGSTREVGPMDDEVVAAVEQHAFRPLTKLYWRNNELDYSSAPALLHTLRRRPIRPYLVPMWDEVDHRSLEELAGRESIAALLGDSDAVRLLWTVCQIPDFRKTLTGSHVELLGRIAGYLLGPDGVLDTDWVAKRVGRLDEPEGDIETLMARIAYIRTWTYIAFQRGWIADAEHWQGRTRQIEDRLSDALHTRLTRRFVDRRAVMALGGATLDVALHEKEVRVGGVAMGILNGLRFSPILGVEGAAGKALNNAVHRALEPVIASRVQALILDDDSQFAVDDRCRLHWRGEALAQLVGGPGILEPRFRLHRLELLDKEQKAQIRARIQRWIADWITSLMAPLQREIGELSKPARGLCYSVEQGLGSVPRKAVQAQIRTLTDADRKALARRSLRLGVQTIYAAAMLGPLALATRARLWQISTGTMLPVPENGRSSFPFDGSEDLTAIGYRGFSGLAVRVDTLEKVAAWARDKSRESAAVSLDPPMSWMGCKRAQVAPVIRGLGFFLDSHGDKGRISRRSRKADRQERG